MKRAFLIIAALVPVLAAAAPKAYRLESPDGKVVAEISAANEITWTLAYDGKAVLEPSAVAMILDDGTAYDGKVRLQKAGRASGNETIKTPFYKKSEVHNRYNELTLSYKTFDLIFRAYDQGVAYRFVSKAKAPFIVKDERADFNFAGDWDAFVPYVRGGEKKTIKQQFNNSFEHIYRHQPLSEWEPGRIAFLPLAVQVPGGALVNITEADLEHYPGMYLWNEDKDSSLEGIWAPYPKTVVNGTAHNNLQGIVMDHEDYIAKAEAGASFPWRIVTVTSTEAAMLDNDMVFNLSRPQAEGDFSWVKPGKVAWDWWNDWNIYGVDFRAGINTETYKYYIDFASSHGIEYVILDEGWAVNKQADLFQIVPEIDLEEIVRYGKAKNVGIILWAGYWAVKRDMEHVFSHFSEMGVKGFKIDFLDRDDQPMIDFCWDCARLGAKYHMMIDFHGASKPAGILRTYPNVLNKEGVAGLENLKWSGPELDQMEYDTTIPFVRMVAGPMDYTQGAMKNAIKENYHGVNSEPMSQGTRCHQLAEYVIFEAPFTMLCDSPSNYMKEEECTSFIASFPTVWDETRAVAGKVGEYAVIARRSGDEWYVGAITNWDARDLEVDLGFLSAGRYSIEYFRDGINADRAACDYDHGFANFSLSSYNSSIPVHLAPGGGCVARISSL
ncbi:MAG: glycoside hydrolase family 97 protein [Bacteroidales bacterium]|nr:glycoside hydrolase family 97 protein [Bacteroidales bacterium]